MTTRSLQKYRVSNGKKLQASLPFKHVRYGSLTSVGMIGETLQSALEDHC